MIIRKMHSLLYGTKRNRQRYKKLRRAEARRELRLETLEQRQLLATGPSLVAALPDVPVGRDGDPFLRNNDFLNEAPREIVLQFSPGQVIDLATAAP